MVTAKKLPDGGEVTATLKFGREYDAPWIVIRGTAEEVDVALDKVAESLGEKVARVAHAIFATNAQVKAEFAIMDPKGLAATRDPEDLAKNTTAGQAKPEQAKPAKVAEPEKVAPVKSSGPSEAELIASLKNDIAKAESIEELRALSNASQYKPVFAAHKELQDAWKARQAEINNNGGN